MLNEWQQFLEQQNAIINHNRVISFGNVQTENQAAAEQCVIADLSHKALVEVSGPDAEKFLQGQLTCDVRELNSQTSRLGAHCNAKGRIISAFRIFQWNMNYYLFMPLSILAPSLAQLQKYAMFSKVRLQQVNALVSIGVAGINAAELLQTFFSIVPQQIDEMIVDNHCVLLRIPGPTPRYEIFGDVANIKKLWLNLQTHARPINADAWQLLTVQAGIPTVYPATIGRFTPHLINYPTIGGVSFTKGCYTGQEVIARMEYLGKLKSHMYRASIRCAQIPKPGDFVYAKDYSENNDVGMVVIAKPDSQGLFQALVVVQDNCVKPNNVYLENQPTDYFNFAELPYQIKKKT